MTTPDLRPCPFCKNSSALRHIKISSICYLIRCDSCEADGPVADDEKSAVEYWNRRASDEEIESLKDDLRRSIEKRDREINDYNQHLFQVHKDHDSEIESLKKEIESNPPRKDWSI